MYCTLEPGGAHSPRKDASVSDGWHSPHFIGGNDDAPLVNLRLVQNGAEPLKHGVQTLGRDIRQELSGGARH